MQIRDSVEEVDQIEWVVHFLGSVEWRQLFLIQRYITQGFD